MNQDEDKLLSVSPSAKRLGIAVFKRAELIYFAVITLKSPRTPVNIKIQVSKIIQQFIEEFCPDSLVIKTLGRHQVRSKKLHLVVNKIKRTAKTAGIPLEEIPFETVKEQLCSGKKRTNAAVFQSLSAIYPELKQFVNHPSRWQADYYEPLLSAAAVGFCCRNKTFKQNQSLN